MRYVYGLFLLFVSAFSCAQTPECVDLTMQALRLGGFTAYTDSNAQFAASPDLAKAVIESWSLPADSTTVVQAALQKGLDPTEVTSELVRLVATGCDPAKMRAVVQLFSTPLVMRATALENHSNSPQGIKELNEYVKVHFQDVPSLPRMAALQKVDAALHIADFNIRSVLVVQSGIAAGLGVPGAQNIKSTYYNDQTRDLMAGGGLAWMLATYRTLSDQEVRDYAQILTSEPLKSFQKKVMDSLLTVKEQRGRIIGQEIFSRLPPGSIKPAAISLGAAGKKKPSQ